MAICDITLHHTTHLARLIFLCLDKGIEGTMLNSCPNCLVTVWSSSLNAEVLVSPYKGFQNVFPNKR